MTKLNSRRKRKRGKHGPSSQDKTVSCDKKENVSPEVAAGKTDSLAKKENTSSRVEGGKTVSVNKKGNEREITDSSDEKQNVNLGDGKSDSCSSVGETASCDDVSVKSSDEKVEASESKTADRSDDVTAERLPYEIKNSDVMGRYLVASRDLKPGEVIIRADPLVVGPCAGCNLICLGCYIPIISNYSKCPDCNWPICGTTCKGLHQPLGHSAEECAALKKHSTLDYDDILEVKNLYQTIVPLRCLLYKSSDPQRWSDINTMVAHNEIRRKIPELWTNNQANVVDILVTTWGMTQFSEDEIHTICGILEVNAFEVGQLGLSIRALYPRAFLLAHDCTPNTTHTDDSLRRLTVRAATLIPKGEAITLSYAYTLQSTQKRQFHLMESKFFTCCCRRCLDPTELGSYAGALLCPRCRHRGSRQGLVLPEIADPSATWVCDTCKEYFLSATSVDTLVQRINDEYDNIDPNDVEGYETLLHRYRNVLHPHHYICLSAKHALSQLYGKVDRHLISSMPVEELNRKIDVCRDILEVFNILEPGYSRLRGITLYELHAPLMILTTRDFENKKIGKNELRVRLKEVVECLRESAKILSLEPKESSEGIMASAAFDALRRIKDWEAIIGKIV